jgi:TolB-like protein
VKDVAAIPNELKLSVLRELSRTLDTGLDSASERQRGLLRYLVTEELEGRGPRIKAYTIATEALNRPADFDPQLDSIVRVEIGRLRQALELHYLTHGAGAPLTISIPKGQYRPVFAETPPPPPPSPRPSAGAPWRRKGLAAAAIAAAILVCGLVIALLAPRFMGTPTTKPARRGPLVAIEPFSFFSDKEGRSYVGGGIQSDLAATLSEFNWITVVPLTEEAARRAHGGSLDGRADYLVRATVRAVNDQLSATAFLLDGKTGGIKWTKDYTIGFRGSEIIAMEREVASKIAMDVGHPFGVISRIERARAKSGATAPDEAFDCKLRALQFWSTRKRADYALARACYEAINGGDPPDADSLAALSILLFDAASLPPDRQSGEKTRAESRRLAEKAYDIDSSRFFPRVARYTAALCAGDIETFRRVGEAMLADLPKHPIAMGDFGAKLVLGANDFAKGLGLIERARTLSGNLLQAELTAPAAAALSRGEALDLKPLREAALESEFSWLSLFYLAAAAAQSNAAEASRAIQRLSDIGLANRADIRTLVEAQCWSRETRDLVAKYVEAGLRLAGAAK